MAPAPAQHVSAHLRMLSPPGVLHRFSQTFEAAPQHCATRHVRRRVQMLVTFMPVIAWAGMSKTVLWMYNKLSFDHDAHNANKPKDDKFDQLKKGTWHCEMITPICQITQVISDNLHHSRNTLCQCSQVIPPPQELAPQCCPTTEFIHVTCFKYENVQMA